MLDRWIAVPHVEEAGDRGDVGLLAALSIDALDDHRFLSTTFSDSSEIDVGKFKQLFLLAGPSTGNGSKL